MRRTYFDIFCLETYKDVSYKRFYLTLFVNVKRKTNIVTEFLSRFYIQTYKNHHGNQINFLYFRLSDCWDHFGIVIYFCYLYTIAHIRVFFLRIDIRFYFNFIWTIKGLINDQILSLTL